MHKTEKGITTNKEFWNFDKPFLTNKGFSKNNDNTLENKIEVTDEKSLLIYSTAIII